MLKKTQTILLFMLVLCGVVLMGGIPTVKAQTISISDVVFDGQVFVTLGADGSVIEACVEDPEIEDPPCEPLLVATFAAITNGAPETHRVRAISVHTVRFPI